MTIFEFVFSLYSLLFGLALAQVFQGFGNTLQERHKLKIGWLTPLLGLFVILDLISFWEIAWQLRDMFERPALIVLILGVFLAGIYYLAARLVFPRDFVEWPTLTFIIPSTSNGCSVASSSATSSPSWS